MKHKFLIIILSVVTIACLAFGISACSDNSTKNSSSDASSEISSSIEDVSSGADSSLEDSSDVDSSLADSIAEDSSGAAVHTHDLQAVEAVAATCTEDGNIAYWYCDSCGKYYSDAEATTEIKQPDTVVIAQGHDYDYENIVIEWSTDYSSATATLTCKSDLSHTAMVDAIISSEVTKSPTCTAEGEITYTAAFTFEYITYCVTHTETVGKTAHSLTHYEESAATCIKDGNTEYWYCATCGKYFSDEDCTKEIKLSYTVITATGHTHADAVKENEVAATCTKDGSYDSVVYCSVCHEEISRETVTVEVTEHALVQVEAQAATCTEVGWDAYEYCPLCDYTTYEEMPATGHRYNSDGICSACGAEKVDSEGLAYILSDDETYYTVSGIGTCADTDLVIPSIYEGLPVAVIDAGAFKNQTQIISVYVPDSVTIICSEAFSGCSSIKSMTLPFVGSVTETSASPSTLFGNMFGTKSCAGCVATAQYYSDRSYRTFYIPSSLTTITIKGGNIFYGTFYNCSRLTNIVIGDGVNYIGDNAFYGCTSLIYNEHNNGKYLGNDSNKFVVLVDVIDTTATSFTVNQNVKFINTSTFKNYDSLISIVVPESVTSIGSMAFDNCTSLEYVYYSGTVSQWASILFNDATANPLYCAHNLYIDTLLVKNITLEGITTINAYAFYNCSSLESIAIGESVATIGEYAFCNCTALKKINFNATAMEDLSSGNGVFYNVGKSGDGIAVTIGAKVTKIPAYLFFSMVGNREDVTKIVSIIFEDNCKCQSIGRQAFYLLKSLKNVNFGENSQLISIGDYAFRWCSSLTNITIPDGVTTIGNDAFDCCYKLVEVYNLSSLEITAGSEDNGCVAYYAKYVYTATSGESHLIERDDYLFVYDNDNNYYLVSYSGTDIAITLPDLIIDDNSVNYEINQYVFYNNTSLVSVTMPNSVTSIGDYAFNGCTTLFSVVIGSSVTYIGNSAFLDCYKLVEVKNLSSLEITAGNEDNGKVAFYAKYIFASGESHVFTQSVYTFVYDENDNYYLVSYNGTDSEIILPDLIINDNSVEYEINQYAFYEDTLLVSVTIPDGVTSIGSYSFFGCDSLENISISNNVITIGSYAFNGCASLESVFYTGTASEWASIAFCGIDANPLLYYANLYLIGTLATDITIEGVTIVNDYAFYNCTSLTNVIIGNGVEIISNYAFYKCTSLESITIGNGVMSIGTFAFSNCTAEIIWGDNPTIIEIGSYSFADYSGTSITIPDSVTFIGSWAFRNCISLTCVIMGNGVETIDKYALYGCVSLENIRIPDSITSIGVSVFSGCASLIYNEYENGYYLGNDSNKYLVLIGVMDLTVSSFNINAKTKIIYYLAFSNCTLLESITIPDNVIFISAYAFYSCISLESINVSANNTAYRSIDGNLYSYDETELLQYAIGKSNTLFTIPDGVISIADQAFYKCTSIESIILPDCVESIGFSTFELCVSLTSVIIGRGVVTIGDQAFFGCTSLESVYYAGTADEWSVITLSYYWSDPTYYGARLYYYAENNGSTTEEYYWYWHYDVNGDIVTWYYGQYCYLDG